MEHIVLIGFKNVGKSSVGRLLAKELGVPFVDSDSVVQELHVQKTGEQLSCREIMKNHGADYFRELEHEALKQVLAIDQPAVVAVGGGAPMHEKNQSLFARHCIIHLTAPKGIIYERIMINGQPAFFPREVDPYISFQKIWNERDPIYQQLARITVDNGKSLGDTIAALRRELAPVAIK